MLTSSEEPDRMALHTCVLISPLLLLELARCTAVLAQVIVAVEVVAAIVTLAVAKAAATPVTEQVLTGSVIAVAYPCHCCCLVSAVVSTWAFLIICLHRVRGGCRLRLRLSPQNCILCFKLFNALFEHLNHSKEADLASVPVCIASLERKLADGASQVDL